MLQSAHNISALAQLAKKLWAKREKELELETENDGSICVLVCCVLACCVFLLPIHNHHHHRRHRQETWTWNEAAKTHTHTHISSTYVIYTILLCPSGCLLFSVLYMLKLGPATNLYKHFTEWKPHKKWRKTAAHWSEFIYILLKRIAF